MPRKKLIRTDQFVYHLTSRSNSKEWFYAPIGECWNIFLDELEFAHKKFELEIHAFVLMNNHYHLMARTPQSNIDKVMHSINKNMALKINMAVGKINHVFGSPYKWSLINSDRYYNYAIKYLYQNPVKVDLCQRVEDYPYSSLKYLDGAFPLRPYEDFDVENLNILFNSEENIRLQKGFKKTYFQPSYNPITRIYDL